MATVVCIRSQELESLKKIMLNYFRIKMLNKAFLYNLGENSNNQKANAALPSLHEYLISMHLFMEDNLPLMNTGYLSLETEAKKKRETLWGCHRWWGFCIGLDH